MAVGPDTLPELFPIKGVRLGTTSAGIKTEGRKDLVVIEIDEAASVAGVFTKNAFCAAPVQIAKQNLSQTSSRYFVINTGNANAGTGEEGLAAANQCIEALAAEVSVDKNQVLPFSTGVIGEPLPTDKIISAIPQAINNLSPDGWEVAASGIMTTDTRPKAASRQLTLAINGEEKVITITGMAKGAGMIKPNMATMLAYIATDAEIDAEELQRLLNHSVDHSFNRITVDGDTSTNDACMLIASGSAGVPINKSASGYEEFKDALTELFIELAQGLVRDGEGASKLVTVAVNSGESEAECLQVAYTIAESPLVKTALFASDPNWGRILAAIGRAGIDALNVDAIDLYIGDVLIAENGGRAASYTEEAGCAVMEQEEIVIRVELNRGESNACVWTSDLSHEYVRINAEYRT